MTTGRNFPEIVRVIDSMQLTAKHKVATPADWKQGDVIISFLDHLFQGRNPFLLCIETTISLLYLRLKYITHGVLLPRQIDFIGGYHLSYCQRNILRIGDLISG